MSEHKEIKAGAGYTIGNILIKGISFISLPIFSRLLTTSDFGLYSTYGAYEAVLTIILGLGMYASIRTAYYDYRGKQNTFVSTQTLIVTALTLLIVVLYSFFQDSINGLTGFSSAITFFMIGQSYGAAMLNIVNAKLALSYRYKSYLGYAAFNTILNVLISIILIYTVLGDDRLLARVAGTSMPLLIIGVVLFVKFERIEEQRFNQGMARYALIYGLPLIGHYLSQQIQSQSDRIMITYLVGASDTGIYSFVYIIANIFQILFYSLDNVWGVWMLSKMQSGEYRSIKERANQYMFLVTIIACGMMVVSREMIMIVGPAKYLIGANLFMPIIVGMYFLFLYTIPVGIEYYYKETKYVGAGTILAALFNVVTNYISIKAYGYVAAAYTTLFSYVLMFTFHWFIAKKILKKNGVEPVFTFGPFAMNIFFVLACAIGTMIANPYPVIKYIVAAIAFAIVVIAFKGIWMPHLEFLKDKKFNS